MAEAVEKTASSPLGPRFAKLWAANTVSALGTGLVTIAAPLFVASRTHNPLTVSAISVAIWIPWLLFSLPGGVFVDRVDRRWLLIHVDLARAVVMATLGVTILLGHSPLWLLFVCLFLLQTGEVLFQSAGQGMIQAVVPHQLLERAIGWLTGGTITMQEMVAAPLGGFFFLLTVSLPFLVNAGTYVVSAVLLATVPGTFRAVAGQVEDGDVPGSGGAAVVGANGESDDASAATSAANGGLVRELASVRSDIAESVRFLLSQRILCTMSVLIGVLNITLTAATAVLVLLAKERFHLNSVGYGLLFTAFAMGGVLASVAGDRIIKRVTATWTIRVGLMIEALTYLVLAWSRSPFLAGVAMFAFGIHNVLWFMVASSLRQRLTPPEMMGRTTSLNLFIEFSGNAVGALFGGVIAKQSGLTAPYWVAFAVAVIVAATTWRIFNRADVGKAYETPAHLLEQAD